MKILEIIALVAAGFLMGSTSLHDFHSSIAEMEFNPRTKTLQVSLRVFTDDLNLALKNASGIDFYEKFESKEADQALQKYIRRHFALVSNSKEVRTPVYYGCEPELDATWIYFEIEESSNTKNFNIFNTIFIDEFDDQVNIVNVIYPDKKKTLIFNSEDTVIKFPF